ncbi:MAG TPA: hypothetical protein VM120_21085 [Bryobacteraceae bacterium]|nr:hypothetical protein [Bryobacteraceae bacterium]
MIYVEYIARRAGVALKDFHSVVRQVQEAWEAGHSSDEMILNAGRTWRVGPEPEYLGIWNTGDSGLERLDDWTRAFRERGEVGDEATMSRVARISIAGCYRALRPPVRARGSVYYVEYFRPVGSDDEIASAYQDRAARHGTVKLNLLAVRIGKLAPDPGGIAVWSLHNFALLSAIAAEVDDGAKPVQLTACGLYADIEEEIL